MCMCAMYATLNHENVLDPRIVKTKAEGKEVIEPKI